MLQQKENDISGKQKQLYTGRDLEKGRCQTPEDIMRFRESADAYYDKLELLKTSKKNAKTDRKVLARIFWKEFYDIEEKIEAELASTIPVGSMDDTDIGVIKDVEVPENPDRYTQIKDWVKNSAGMAENVIDAADKTWQSDTVESIDKSEKTVEKPIMNSSVIDIIAETPMRGDTIAEKINIPELPGTKTEYDKLSIDEKIERFQFGDISEEQASDIVSKYLNTVGYSSYSSEIYEESNRVSDTYGKLKQQTFVTCEVDKAIAIMTFMDMMKQQFAIADVGTKAMLFDLASVDYKIGLQIYRGFLKKIELQKDVMEVYEEFDKVYEASVKDRIQDKEKTRESR